MRNILNRGFSSLSLDALITKVTFIITQVTGNPAFPLTTPHHGPSAGRAGCTDHAMTLADPHARELAVGAARASLEQLLENLADNLETTANNDPVPLATAGFDMRKTTAQTDQPLDVPQNVRVKLTGQTGECQVLFEPPARARSYQVHTSIDPNLGPWADYDTFSSSRNIILKNFPRAMDLWVRVRAIGPNNTKSAWSDPATILIN